MNTFVKIGDTYVDPTDIRYFKTADSRERDQTATYFKLKSGDFLIINGVSAEEVSELLGPTT